MLDKNIPCTVEAERNIPENTLNDKCQLTKLLSYHPVTDVHLSMEDRKIVDNFHHSIFRSIVSNVMNWLFFLAFAPVENVDKKDGK
jgi:hypothetical protein